MSKYIYKGTEFIGSVFDEISDKDILNVHEGAIILGEYIEYPKLKGNTLVPMTASEIQAEKFKRYERGEYTLKNDEVIDNGRVVEVTLKEYEYIMEGVLKYDAESKKKALLDKTKVYEEEEKEKAFEFKGYLQPNRELEDQTSLLKILSFMQMTKQTHFDNWKMKDLDGNEHYVSLTIQEMMQLGQMMQTQTTTTMIKWSKIREHIKGLSAEELKVYEITR